MARKVALPAAIAALALGLLLASVVSAAVRHTRELPASFIATEGSSGKAELRLAELVTADLNRNGIIDQSDLNGVVRSLGSTPKDGSLSDLNGDGLVDVLDLVLVAMNYGLSVNPQDQ